VRDDQDIHESKTPCHVLLILMHRHLLKYSPELSHWLQVKQCVTIIFTLTLLSTVVLTGLVAAL